MPNTNCLENIACPTCGQEDRFEIHAAATFEVTDDGTSEGRGVQWDANSAISCPACREFGRIKDFYPRESFVIVHDKFGLYLGTILGLSVWSRLDPVEQTHAPSFERHHAQTLHAQHPHVRLVRVPTYPRAISPAHLDAFGLETHTRKLHQNASEARAAA